MNIAVNTRLLLKNKLEGIGWFSYETLKRITQNHSEHRFFFIFDRKYDEDFIFSDNITPIIASPPTRHPVLWVYWFEFVIPGILKKINADIFVSPDGYLSLRSKVPSVAVIHDLNFVHNPAHLPMLVRWYYNYFFKKFAHKALRVGTVSEYSKKDINETYSVDNNKIDVIYNGSNKIYQPVDDETKEAVKKEYTDSKDFFIFIGAINPRKNVQGLLKSFDIYKTKSKSEHKLVIVGNQMHLTGEVNKTFDAMTHKKDVLFVGRLEVEKLHKLLASSIALVFVPFFEGFGIPLVEAMYCDVPIICSNKTSIPEVVGDAGIVASPDKHEEIADLMIKIASDTNLRNNIINEGRKQREKFSWDKSAENFWNCIEKAIKEIKE